MDVGLESGALLRKPSSNAEARGAFLLPIPFQKRPAMDGWVPRTTRKGFRPMNARRAFWTSLATVAMATALVGCALSQSAMKPGAGLSAIGREGQLVTPKRCRLDVVFLTRPQGDRVFNEIVWQVADEQIIEPDLRRALQVNGLRYGRITGELPSELQELLQAGPPDQPQTQMILNPSGTPTLLDTAQAPAKPSLSLLLSQPDGSVKGKQYEDAKGFLRLVPSYEGTDEVSIRITPELHHGPISAGFGTVPTDGLPMPREFKMTSGQKEESFRELAATIDLKAGQVAVLGVRPERSGSLGDILFQQEDGNSDRILQNLVLIRASRTGSPDALLSTTADQPNNPTPALVPIDPADLTRTDEPEAVSKGQKPSEN